MSPILLDRLREPGGVRTELQPIVVLGSADGGGADDRAVAFYAVEALSRGPRGTSLERADVLFEYARRKGHEAEVDLLCMRSALDAIAGLPGDLRVSLNVHGSTLSVPAFADELLALAAARGIAAGRLMLEIVEHRSLWSMDTFSATLEHLRDAGVCIALDDLGVAASNYRMLVDCRPDHLKVDRYIVRGCADDHYRLAVLRSIVTLASGCDAVPIAEGVEDERDLAALRALGIRHFQGWLWARSMTPAELADSPFLLAPCAG